MPGTSPRSRPKPKVYLIGQGLPKGEQAYPVSWLIRELPLLVDLVSSPRDCDLLVAISPIETGDLATTVIMIEEHLGYGGRVLVIQPIAEAGSSCFLVQLARSYPDQGDVERFINWPDAMQTIYRRAHAIAQASTEELPLLTLRRCRV